MKQLSSAQVRQMWLDFWATKGHSVEPSVSLVPVNDPTLLWINSGVATLKKYFDGTIIPENPRITNAQKAIRTNDIENVGKTARHHTMFEMLGNWSFGDYFKKEAIEWAWEFLTEVLKVDKSRLYVTVFEGAEDEGLHRDEEAAGYWAQYLPQERILNGNKHDNFWEMGDQGPCGPCSEIHIDIRSEEERKAVDGLTLVNQGHPQVIEIWNLVFMQFNRKADGSLDSLPNHVIDTGMGFERLCMAIQGKTSNYDTDVFTPIIQAISTLTGVNYGADAKSDVAMRVIADHIRTIAFAITDGQLPSNAKAGYVIRRILRRAVRYGYTFLGRRDAFMYSLIPALIDSMGDAYPELIKGKDLIQRVIKEEEESFLRTLETGIRLLEKKIEELGSNKTLSGDDAFVLYDTYGFPLDLTALILSEHGCSLDEEGFNVAMEAQRARARNAAALDTEDWVILREGETTFLGYDYTECDTEILRYRKVKQKNKEYYQVVLSSTPFYAEMGGQVGDSGYLTDGTTKYEVFDTKRENNLPVHLMTKLPEDASCELTAVINIEKRHAAEANHTATHLLHEALREILGTHVEQKGSFVSPDVLRFDFSHFSKVEPSDLRKVEQLVNERIRENFPREEFRNVPIAEAQAMGAMALFGEKYGEEVRVLKYGTSIELCGGTHVSATGRIGFFRIISESSVAAGVRRIEAVTGAGAEKMLYQVEDLLKEVKELFNNNPQIITAIKKTIEENAELAQQVQAALKEKVASVKQHLLSQREELGGVRIFKVQQNVSAELIKDLAFQIAGELTESFIFIGATDEGGKPNLTLMLSRDLVESKGWNASNILRSAAKHIQGGGGGQPHFATAGGKRVEGLDEAVQQILSETVGA